MVGPISRLRPPPWVQDVLLAAFVAFGQASGTRNAAAAAGVTAPDALGFALLVGSGAVLVVRRRWPVPVLAVTVASSVVYYLAGNPDGSTWLGLFVALYTLTAYGDGRRSLWIAAASIAGLTVVWLLTAELQPVAEAGWVFFRIGGVIMSAALGESVRSRRVIAAEAQARAELAERTREEEARRRVDAERLRIAREVHDTVAHAIAIVNVQAGVTAHVLDRRPERAREALLTIEQTSARALRELRETLGMLRGGEEDDRAPTPGLGQLDDILGQAKEAGLDVKAEVPAPPAGVELPSAVDRAAYRILQESITNVIRHAGPAQVTVRVGWGACAVEIEVSDDGHGPNGMDGAAGHGIEGMQERCALLGGELTAGPGPAGGFRVRARLPLTATAAVSP